MAMAGGRSVRQVIDRQGSSGPKRILMRGAEQWCRAAVASRAGEQSSAAQRSKSKADPGDEAERREVESRLRVVEVNNERKAYAGQTDGGWVRRVRRVRRVEAAKQEVVVAADAWGRGRRERVLP